MNLKEAMKRIEELERRVRELEARPKQEIHYHTHQAPYVAPFQPLPAYPFIPHFPTWTPVCGAHTGAAPAPDLSCVRTFNIGATQ